MDNYKHSLLELKRPFFEIKFKGGRKTPMVGFTQDFKSLFMAFYTKKQVRH